LHDIVYAMGAGGAGAQGAPPGGFLGALTPMIIIFAILYFLIIRPQNKKAKLHQQMVENLKKGDKVITSGGIYGRVTKADDIQTVTLEIADKVKVKCLRGNISQLITDQFLPSSGKAD